MKVVELGKRTQTLMFLRESLYRLCEMSTNFQLPPEEVRNLYKVVIEAALEIAEAELTEAKAEEARQKARTAKALKEIKEENRKYLDKLF